MLNKAILILILIFSLGSASKLYATHIVGGEMNYTCLGNDEYEITLTIFRDCFNGNPAAWFDNPASIGVFNADNDLLTEILIPLMNNDTLKPVLSNECLVIPPNVCVHTTTYRTVVNLPPIDGGYQLAYQRCCRNVTIVNIIDPLDSGATYGVTISERALQECNSNPKFAEWPPIYICVNEPIDFDQSAVDEDGDSIVYRLCTPLLGATPDFPQPQPPNPPPYAPINWVNPPYSVNNMLNGIAGSPPLEIDAQTGFLTGTPNTIGQFVVGICVEEYRDGELISTTRRDFQYNVGVCGQAASAFFGPSIQCGDFEVELLNQSEGADNYLWLFNDPNNLNASATTFNANYTYSDTGTYTVMLIAEPGSVCADTAIQEINLQLNSLEPDFSVSYDNCTDSITIEVTDLTTDFVSQPIRWDWRVEPSGLVANIANPTFRVGGITTEEVLILLEVEAANGCIAQYEEIIPVAFIRERIELNEEFLCPGEEIALNPEHNSNYIYSWSPVSILSDPSSANPIASPLESTTVYVTITDSTDFCQLVDSVELFVSPPIEIDLPPDTTICATAFLLEAISPTAEQFQWSTTPDFNNPFSEEASTEVQVQNTNTYYIQVLDNIGCNRIDSLTIVGNGIEAELETPNPVCDGESGMLQVNTFDPIDSVNYNWQPASQIASGQGSNTIVSEVLPPGIYDFSVVLENQFNCQFEDTTQLTVIDTSFQVSFLSNTQCSGYRLSFEGLGPNANFFVWNFGDPSNPEASAAGANVEYSYPGPGSYTIQVSLAAAVPCPDTIYQTIEVREPAIQPDFNWNLESCGATALLQFTDLSENTQSAITGWEWMFSNGMTSIAQNPQLSVDSSQLLEATLVLLSSDGCQDTIQQTIPIELIQLDLPDTLAVCYNTPVELNPAANTSFVYNWTPGEGLVTPFSPNPSLQALESTLYTVDVTDSTGVCQQSDTIQLVVTDPFSVEILGDTIICQDSTQLSAIAEGFVQLEWAVSSSFNSILGTDTLLEVELPSTETVTFYLRGEDAEGCRQLDSMVVENQAIDALVPFLYTVCSGDTSRLEVFSASADMLDYSWTPAIGILEGADSATPLISLADVEEQEYQVEISNVAGCTETYSTLVNVINTLPPLAISADQDTIFGSVPIQLEATLNNTYLYEWELHPSLSGINIYNPVALPTENTTYQLTITDESGCRNTAEITIIFRSLECEEPFIFIPQAFTPNGDGKNDQLFVRGNNIDELYFAVYNRWGERVFETQDQSIGWDGTYKGRLLSPDAFGYYVEIRCFNGEAYFKKGNVSLLR